MMISIYELRILLDEKEKLDITNYKQNVEHVKDWFTQQFDLYMTEAELNKALGLIGAEKSIKEIKYIDELLMYNGDYEFLAIHYCEYETKFWLV